MIALSAAALSGCGGGDDESAPASGTAQPPPAPPPAPTNHAPTISGTAPAAVNAASPYSFVPTAADADGDTLAFSIQNKPAWAAFNTTTGRLSGTPAAADVGTYSNISISVSDGEASTALNAFAIAVTASLERPRHAVVDRADREHGRQHAVEPRGLPHPLRHERSALTSTIVIDNASVTTFVVEDLAPATWYFAVTAVTSAGAESSLLERRQQADLTGSDQ